ncbi:enoyl-CoA hydratase/isomerase family protein [Amantichitinum ursilacus]|uniref:3-hydroxyisobutyryl-CoA hydrolase n=1 Tax=Amantichitinum ursilacus TaxID=857265 RepID=A0A0N0XKT9_9NEIS|nr:enoyl-CoA hydratase/isomerase family protein [Amantichitinum ursilacus]KPC54517.1 Carnitinyl-CoA dehydratase [Amantichitinum ursilacus]
MVRFELIPTRNGALIGEILLDTPGTLNAQNLQMVLAMRQQLAQWHADPTVVAIVIHGAGERALCAGGDIKALYYAMLDPERIHEADDFFANEYLLCRELHRYPKPVLAWGNGLIMGGGWGLFAASSHRVVTETAQLAMPEIAIGLFPDVGASAWLGELADGVGRFLLLTASRLNATDALAAGAADWALPAASFATVREAMTELGWLGQPHIDAHMLSQLIDALGGALQPTLPEGNWQPLRAQVTELVAGDDLDTIVARIDALQSDHPWLQNAQMQLRAGSPTSIALGWALAQRAVGMAYDDVVAMETLAAQHAVRYSDFREGVRARLIDRDGAPQWAARPKASDIETWLVARNQK